MLRLRSLPLLASALLGAVAAFPTLASAGTLSVSGTTITYVADPGEKNFVTVNWGNGAGGPSPPWVSDHEDIVAGPGCEEAVSGTGNYECPSAGVHPTVILRLGDQDDIADSSNDQSAGNHVEIYGEEGNDDLESSEGNDLLDGGPGNDSLEPDDGDEGPGDVVRGGDGVDELNLVSSLVDSLTATLDGVADDGAPGENDNYAADLENVLGSPVAKNRIVGTAGPNSIRGGDQPDDLSGGGGDDTIQASDGNDKLDGGDGSDRLEGYSGDDTIIGGGGTDSIDGDGIGGAFQVVAGNDRIEARDGIAEPINCGLGADTAIIDANDIVPTDPATACEVIDRGVAPTPPGPPLPAPKPAGPTVASSALRYRDGRIAVSVGCPADGATCRGTVRVRTASRVKVGKRRVTVTLGSASYTVSAGKRKTVKLKPGKTARSVLRRVRKVKVTVELTPRGAKKAAAKRAVTLKR